MKNFVISFVLFNLLALVGCRTVLYTHEQVIDRYKTKQDVAKTFGAPNEKMVSDTSDAWLYVYTRNGFRHLQEQSAVISTATVAAFGKHDRFVVFMFDKRGKVLRWQAERVDLSVTKPSAGKTIALVVGLSAIVIALAAIVASSLRFSFTGY